MAASASALDVAAMLAQLGSGQASQVLDVQHVPLWPSRERPRMIISAPTSQPMHRRAAMIVFRGGAYAKTGSGQGCVEYLRERDIVAVEVEYTTLETINMDATSSGLSLFPTPFQEAARAVRLVRSRAADFDVDPNRIGVVGFSAGGHVASIICTGELPCQESLEDDLTDVSFRPDVCILGYPVISMLPELRGPGNLGNSAENLGFPDGDEENLSSELLVTVRHPPTFLWHTREDECVPIAHSENYVTALKEHGVSHEFVSYEHGPHALSMALEGEYANDWADRMMKWLGAWAEPRFCPPAKAFVID